MIGTSQARHINSSNRALKYAHENLCEVPRGPLGLLEVSESCNTEDGVTACETDNILVHETDRDIDSITTLSNSDTMSVSSDTMSVSSNDIVENMGRSRTDSEGSVPHSIKVVTDAEVHRY